MFGKAAWSWRFFIIAPKAILFYRKVSFKRLLLQKAVASIVHTATTKKQVDLIQSPNKTIPDYFMPL